MRRVPCGHFRPRRYEQFLHRTRGATLEIAYLADILVLIQRHRKYVDALLLCRAIMGKPAYFVSTSVEVVLKDLHDGITANVIHIIRSLSTSSISPTSWFSTRSLVFINNHHRELHSIDKRIHTAFGSLRKHLGEIQIFHGLSESIRPVHCPHL